MTREITTFRKVDGLYSRDYEVHRLRLYDPNDTQTALSNIGFQTRTLSGYADFKFPPGLVGFLCRKPSPGVSTR